PRAALTMLLPPALRCQERRVELAHRRDDLAKAVRNPLSREPAQERLRIEQVEMARPAFHEEEDGALRLGGMVAGSRSEVICCGRLGRGRLAAQQVRQGEGAEADAALEQKVTARRRRTCHR